MNQETVDNSIYDNLLATRMLFVVVVYILGRSRHCKNNRCLKPKIDFSVTVTDDDSVEFQWTSPSTSLFGYCVRHECDSDEENVNYCTGGVEVSSSFCCIVSISFILCRIVPQIVLKVRD